MAFSNLFSDKNERKAQDKLVSGYKEGLSKLEDSYGQAQDRYDPYVAAGEPATGMYSDALGLNGSRGNQRAVNAFQAGPGYQWQLEQGQQAIERTAASRGMLASGNTNLDLMRYGQGLANQEYNNWLGNLNNQQYLGLDATNRQAAIDTGLGDVRYATQLGKAGARSSFQAGKDQTGANIVGAVGGGISTGAQLLAGPISRAPYVGAG